MHTQKWTQFVRTRKPISNVGSSIGGELVQPNERTPPTSLRPSEQSSQWTLHGRIGVLLNLTVVYFLAGKLGLRLAFANPSATAVWPPTGIAFAAFLIIGYWVWPGILLAAFLTNLATAGSVATSISIAVGNTLEGMLGAYLVSRFAGGRHVFDRTQNIFKFAFLAAMISTMVSATCGVTSLILGGFASWADYGAVWLTWWLGDAAGDLVVAPLLFL